LKEYLVDGWWNGEYMSCLSYACEGRKEGQMDGRTDNELVIYGWSAARAPACLPCHMHAKKERTDIDAHNVKSQCNMKIVPFKGVLWLLGGARRQLHGKRRLRVLWLLVGARRQVRLPCTPRKDGHRRLRAETLIVLLQLLVYTFCNFKGNEIHIRYILQIHLHFFWISFLLDLHFYTVIM
jgi:hypothetical protein